MDGPKQIESRMFLSCGGWAALHVYGDHEYGVLPLETPDLKALPPVGELCRNPAVTLFLKRAAATNPGLTLTEENAGAIAEICSRAEGLPLAIELAAARSKFFSPAAMLERFTSALDLSTDGPRDVPASQQTLRNTIEGSYRQQAPCRSRRHGNDSVAASRRSASTCVCRHPYSPSALPLMLRLTADRGSSHRYMTARRVTDLVLATHKRSKY